MATPQVATRTVEETGVWLPYHREAGELYPAVSGTVFITMSTLLDLSEQGLWDSHFGSAFLLGTYEGIALVTVGFAEKETKGGFYGTEALKAWLVEVGQR